MSDDPKDPVPLRDAGPDLDVLERDLADLLASRSGEATRILVATGDAAGQRLFASLFARDPEVTLYVVDSAAEALEQLQPGKFPVLVADEKLPGPPAGADFVAAARAKDRYVEILAVIDFGRAASVVRALDAGATDYVARPFESVLVVRDKARAALRRHFWHERIHLALSLLAERVQQALAAIPADQRRPLTAEIAQVMSGGTRAPDAPLRLVAAGGEALAEALRGLGEPVEAVHTLDAVAVLARTGVDVVVAEVDGGAQRNATLDRVRDAAPLAELVVVARPFADAAHGPAHALEPWPGLEHKLRAAMERRRIALKNRDTAHALLALLRRALKR